MGWRYKTGMNWIFISTRMAIYARDHFDCVWCKGVFPVDPKGFGLSLDHLDHDAGNGPENLVTCCLTCNPSRRDMSLAEWLRGDRTRRARMQAAVKRPLNRPLGRLLAAYRKGAPIAHADIPALRRVAGDLVADTVLYGIPDEPPSMANGEDGW